MQQCAQDGSSSRPSIRLAQTTFIRNIVIYMYIYIYILYIHIYVYMNITNVCTKFAPVIIYTYICNIHL